jgi:hypothetical protein
MKSLLLEMQFMNLITCIMCDPKDGIQQGLRDRARWSIKYNMCIHNWEQLSFIVDPLSIQWGKINNFDEVNVQYIHN